MALTPEQQQEVDAILREADLGNWDAFAHALAGPLGQAAAEGVVRGFSEIKVDDPDALDLANDDAVAWASDRAAELVGMRRTPDGLGLTANVPPWAITETTREGLRDLVGQALGAGWTAQELSQAVEQSWLFSPARADTIARTELAFAQTAGHLAAWTRSGVVSGKRSLLSDLHDDDDVCDGNAEAGIIPLGQAFPSGHSGPPYHPNCECRVVAVVDEPVEKLLLVRYPLALLTRRALG